MPPTGHPTLILDCATTVLPALPADHFHCCVTSPPYFKLRSYLPTGHDRKHHEIGSEPTVEVYIRTLVDVFRGVRHALHPSGLLFLNLGDSSDGSEIRNIPHRVAEALRADGWLWRQTIVWAKPAPMPESLTGWQWVLFWTLNAVEVACAMIGRM